jgi:hypothetical protein
MTSRKSSGSSRDDSSVEANQIAEHHRQLPALGISGRRGVAGRCYHRSGRRCDAERSNCGQQLSPVAARGHADTGQVIGRQLRQHFSIGIVFTEGRRVTFEPQPAQPRHYVHAVTLGSEGR